MIIITIQSVSGADYFKIKEAPAEFFDSKAKHYELSRNSVFNQDSEKILVSARNIANRDYLFSNVAVESIEVDGEVYSSFEDLADVLAPILFKKGGGTGGGGTGSVTVIAPLTGNGNDTPLSINPATSSNRGTMSSADFTKLAGFSQSGDYALKTEVTALDSSLKAWVNDKNYVTSSNLTTNYYTKSEVDGKLFSVFIPKPKVATIGDLPPTGNTYGDVREVVANGKNYVWVKDYNGVGNDGWDDLGGNIDLSAYYTAAQTETAITSKGYITSLALVGYATENWVTTQTTPATQAEVEAATGTESNPTSAEPATENRKFLTLFNFFKLIKKLRYIHLLPNSATAVANRFWSNGIRLLYANNSAVVSTVAYTSDLPTTFVYTPTGNFTTSQLKTAAENAGLIFNGLHFIIKIGTNNYTCTIDNGSSNTECVITFGKRGTTGSINFASTRTLRAGAENITILNGNVNSLAMLNFDTSEDFLTVYNNT